jgi:phosphoglycolate phosphatase
MLKYSTIFFDLDGTLCDSLTGIQNCIEYTLAQFGIKLTADSDIKKLIGMPLQESLEQFYFHDKDKAWEAVGFFRKHYEINGICQCTLYTGIATLLKTLKEQGANLYILTAKPTPYAKKIAAFHNVDNYFDAILGCELDGSNSEKSFLIDSVLRKMPNRSAQDCVMVGDRKHDVFAGKATGINTIGILYGYGSSEELKNAGADHCFATVEDLKNFLLLQ